MAVIIGPFGVPPRPIPRIGVKIGGGSTPSAILEAIELDYSHIQATIPGTPEQNQASRDAIVQALHREEDLFISCRFQYNGACPDTITKELKTFLESQQLRYIDLFLIEWAAAGDGNPNGALIPAVWTAMEECQSQGLTKSIGVCDFSTTMLKNVLNFAAIPPFAYQVGMQVYLTGKELRQFCEDNQISLVVIGGSDVNQGFAAGSFEELQAGLDKDNRWKWAYEQGASLLLESFTKEHLQELLAILAND